MPNIKGRKITTNGSETGPDAIKRQERRAVVLEHRRQGRPYKEIAQLVGVSVRTAFKDTKRAMRDMLPQETVQQVAKIELARFDEMIEVYYPKMLAGDQAAGEFCLKIARERLHLTGAYPNNNGRPVNFNNINLGSVDNSQNRTIVIEGINPSKRFDSDGNEINRALPPPISGPRPIGADEMRDEASLRYPHTLDARPEPSGTSFTPPPPEPPRNRREHKEALAERAALEGFGQYSDNGPPGGSAFDKTRNPNRIWRNGRYV